MTATLPATGAPVVTVFDCATVVWDDYGAVGLGSFAALHRAEFDDAGRELIRLPLIAAWRQRGYKVKLIERREFYAMPEDTDLPPIEVCQQVWQEAADAVHSDALLAFCDLTDEYDASRKDEG